MSESPTLVSSYTATCGAQIEQHRYSDRLDFLPEYFWIARWPWSGPFHKGAGATPTEALDALITKQHSRAA